MWDPDTEYEFIRFVQIDETPKTKFYSCQNNKSRAEIGLVKWYPGWRQYCFFPREKTVFSEGCLHDIRLFIQMLMQSHSPVRRKR